MPLETEGVRLVLEGYSKFISEMSNVVKSIAGVGDVSKKQSSALIAMAKAAAQTTAAISRMAEAEQKAQIAYQNHMTANAKARQEKQKAAQESLKLAQAEQKTAQSANQATIAQQKTAQSANALQAAQQRTTQTANMLRSAQEKTAQAAAILLAAQQKTAQSANALQVAQQKTTQAFYQTQAAQQRTAQTANLVAVSQNKVSQAYWNAMNSAERTARAAQELARSQEFTRQRTMLLATTMAHLKSVSGALRATLTMINPTLGTVAALFINTGNKINGVIGSIVKFVASGFGLTKMFGMLTGSTDKSSMSMFGWIKAISLGATIANLASSAIQSMGRYLLDMGKKAVESAGNIQYLTIRIENLIARQYRLIDSTMDLNKSLELASTRTSALTEWMQDLALSTPFSADDISETFSMALAMGWTEEAAQELTTAILNYSAGMGLASDQMDRIIFNFAQMKAAGKVTATEMRDLARGAFFPLTQVLDEAAKNLDISAEGLIEFRKAASEGAIDIEAFFDAFITVANRDFPDAAQKMNFTLIALKDNIKDFFETVIGWDLLGKVVAKFSLTATTALAKLSKAFRGTAGDATNSFEVYDDLIGKTNEQIRDYGIGWSKLGDGLVFIFDSVTSALGNLWGAIKDVLGAFGLTAPTVRDVAEAMAVLGIIITNLAQGFRTFVDKYIVPFIRNITNKFSGMADDAFSWGANLISEFAQGIVRTAAAVLTAAMNWISNLLTSWLSPGSPPKILPEIDEWGAETMAEYLHGFLMADFDVLDSVQGLVEDALGALADLGTLDESVVGDMFVGISKNLIEALHNFRETGEIGTEIFGQLRSIGGGFGEELAILLERQVALSDAIEAAALAQEELNRAQRATDQATKRVNGLVKEYNALLRAGADKRTLDAKLAELNAAKDELDVARERETAAEENLAAAEAALAPLREAVELQERLIEQLVELAKAQAEAWDSGGGGDDGGGGDEDDDGEGLPEFPGGGGGIDTWFDEIKKQMEEKLAGLWETLMSGWKDSINKQGEQIKQALGALWDFLLGYWEQIVANFTQAWENFMLFMQTYGPGILDKLGAALGTLVGFFIWLGAEIALFLSQVALDWSLWLLENGPLIDKFAGFVANLATKVTELGTAWWMDLKPGLWQWNETVQTGLTTLMEVVTSASFDKMLEAFKNFGIHLGDLFGWLFKLSGILVEHALIAFGQWWEDHGDNIATIVTNVSDAFGNLVDTIATEETMAGVVSDFDQITQFFSDLVGLPIDALAGDLDGVASALARMWENPSTEHFEENKQKIIDFFNELYEVLLNTWIIISNLFSEEAITDVTTNAAKVGDGVVDGYIEGFDGRKDEALETVNKFGDDAIAAMPGYDDWWSVGYDVTDGMYNGMVSKQDELNTLAKDIGKGVTDSVSVGAGTNSPSTYTYQTGSDIVQGLINGMAARLEELKAMAKEIGKATVAVIAEESGSTSPSKITYQTGLDIMQGLINGLHDAESDLNSAIEDIVENMELADVFKLGGSFSSFGGTFSRMFQKQTLDPLKKQASEVDKRIEELKKALASDELSSYARVSAEAELANLMKQRVRLSEDIAANEEKIFEFQQQQQKLDLLKQQMELLNTITQYGLNPEDILGGIELGVDASIEDLLLAMTRAMEAIVSQAEEDLEIGSPSKVFERIGKQITAGFSQGILNTATQGRAAIRALVGSYNREMSATRTYATPVAAQPTMSQSNVNFGNVYVNDRMDWATFKNQVHRAIMER